MTLTQRFLTAAIILGLLAAAGAYLSTVAWLWHPLGYCPASLGRTGQVQCESYNFHSGIEGDIPVLGQLFATLVLIAGFWHRHNCHHLGCLWPVRHGKTHCPKHEREAAA